MSEPVRSIEGPIEEPIERVAPEEPAQLAKPVRSKGANIFQVAGERIRARKRRSRGGASYAPTQNELMDEVVKIGRELKKEKEGEKPRNANHTPLGKPTDSRGSYSGLRRRH